MNITQIESGSRTLDLNSEILKFLYLYKNYIIYKSINYIMYNSIDESYNISSTYIIN